MNGDRPEAWIELPGEDDLRGLMGRALPERRGVLPAVQRAVVTGGRYVRQLPALGRLTASFVGMAGSRFPYDFGFVPNMGRLLFAHPDLCLPFALQYARLMGGPGALDRREREMVAAVASAAQESYY
jgi:hypothetical protein